MKFEDDAGKKRLIVAPTAQRDLLEIWRYIAEDNPDAADRMSTGFSNAFRQLQDQPRSGRTRSDLAGDRDVRFWRVGDYPVIYRVMASTVEIAAVLHGSRDIPAVLGERDEE
jgi:addiction module RelE/StbE family toxin